jgi:hypothetical protein
MHLFGCASARRKSTLVFFVAAFCLSVPLASAESPEIGPHRIVIRLYNTFGVSVSDMRAAQLSAQSTLEDAGIAVAWRACTVKGRRGAGASDRCEDSLGADEVIMRILATPSSVKRKAPETLGYSYVDARTSSGVLSAVFADRIQSLAVRASTAGAVLLGHAIAHEVGHLLLGMANHSATGLMRARWLLQARRERAKDWSFSEADVMAMHANLERIRVDSAEISSGRLGVPVGP